MLWKKESNQSDALFINICDEGEYTYCDSSSLMDESKALPGKSNELSSHYRQKATEQYETKRCFEAIEQFNQALCFAEVGSVEMAHSFAGRASCFLQLKMFDECLTDIQLAKANKCPQEFQSKLSKISAICNQKKQQLPKREQNAHQFVPTLSFKPNKQYPCAADAIQFRKRSNLHRFVEATREIGVGQTVLIEDGFASTTIESYKRCCICLKTTVNLVPCQFCTDSLFCHRSCENNRLHSIECEESSLQNDTDEDEVDYRLVVRSILMAFQIIPNVNGLIRFVDRGLLDEYSDLNEVDWSQQSKYATFLQNGKKMLKWADEEDDEFFEHVKRIYRVLMDNDSFSDLFGLPEQHRFLMHLIGHHMCALRYSSVGVSAGVNDGTSVYPIAGGFFRHSCIPNVALVTSDRSIIAIAIRPIQNKQELTVSYLPSNQLDSITVVRQMTLSEQFYFRCKCDRCKNRNMNIAQSKNGLSQQFMDEIEDESNFHPKMQKMRKKLTQTCVKYLSGNTEWSYELCLAMNTYIRLIREKYFLNIHH